MPLIALLTLSLVSPALWAPDALAAPLPQTPLPQVTAPDGPATGTYRVGPRDLLRIQVFEEEALQGLEVRVSEEGTIRLPLLGEVQVEGLTDAEILERIKTRLEASFLRRATVAVEVLEFRARPISVIGAVREPGRLDVAGRLTLLEVLTAAGGLAPDHGDLIYVLRRASNGLTDQVAIPVEDLLVRADPAVNIPILANDLVNVPATVSVTVYCLGEVTLPGALEFKSTERMTLLAAIARAGGVTDRASRKVTIKRRESDGSTREIEVDYKRIVAGDEPDPELRAGDVVVVKESFF